MDDEDRNPVDDWLESGPGQNTAMVLILLVIIGGALVLIFG